MLWWFFVLNEGLAETTCDKGLKLTLFHFKGSQAKDAGNQSSTLSIMLFLMKIKFLSKSMQSVLLSLSHPLFLCHFLSPSFSLYLKQ